MYEVKIERMDHEGRGIGYIENVVTFIKNALPGEIVKCIITKKNKNFYEAERIEYIKKSPKRVCSFCSHYEKCGGCHLEHMTYEDTLLYKEKKIENILIKEKIEYPTIQVLPNDKPKNYRNKLSLKIKDGKLGFYEESTHNLIEISACPLARESINASLEKIKKLGIIEGEVTIRTNTNEEILIGIETDDSVLFKEEDWQGIKLVGIVVNGKTIYGQNFFYERLAGFLFKVSYDAFFQINPRITEKLFSIVRDNIQKENTVLDLYAGVGTLGIIAGKKGSKVYSIEIVKNAVLNALENKKLNHIANVFPMLGNAKDVLPKIKDPIDTIIIDPPRKGLDKNSRNIILNSNAKKIIYISCNPHTFARDVKELMEIYEMNKLYMLDMFSYTYHVECVCVMSRR